MRQGDVSKNVKYSLIDLEIESLETATDIHFHTDYSDGRHSLSESIEEAIIYGVYEKGTIEHGNPADEDIDHPTTFLEGFEGGDQSYTSSDIYPYKFETIRTIVDDISGASTLTDADTDKLREDIDTLNRIDETYSSDISEECLNYTIVVPHGVELDYNPAIEVAEDPDKAVESYEDAIIDFLREAESKNSGYNYVLLSSHYVNTPFEPRYVKKDELFENMPHDKLGEVLEHYRDKEISKIESLSSKLGGMSIPTISEELMYNSEIEELEDFVYDQSSLIESLVKDDIESDDYLIATEGHIDISRPGVFAVGAHPTLIERNEELLDYFREEQGLTTKQEISEAIGERLGKNITKHEVDSFLGDAGQTSLYPDKELKKYYKTMIEAADDEENFIFEINGKGIERQHPSIFWEMVGDHTFGSDSHRLGEQPKRSLKFQKSEKSGETIFLSELWLSQLDKDRRRQEKSSFEGNPDQLPKEPESLEYLNDIMFSASSPKTVKPVKDD